MDKTTSVAAALDAGKLPSTEQINAFIDWLMQTIVPAVLPADDSHLSSQGQMLANDTRDILAAYKALNSNKNGDSLLQDAIWHLTHGDFNVIADLDGANMEEAAADGEAVRSNTKNLLAIFWRSITQGDFLLKDFASFATAGLADAAEVVEEQAARAKDTLREVNQDIQAGERDSLGRDKQRLEEEKDTRVAFEHRMDTLKEAGSYAIGVGQTAKEKKSDLPERVSDARRDAYRKVFERTRSDPTYRSSFSTLLGICHKWISKAIDPNTTSRLETLFEDSPEGLNALKTLLDRFANPESSVDAVLEKAQRFVSAARGKHGQVQAWVDEYFAYASRTLDDPDYADSDEALRLQQELQQRSRVFLSADSDMGRTWADLKGTARAFGAAVAADADLHRVYEAHKQLGKDAMRGLVESTTDATAAMEQATWFWRDLFAVYAQRVLSTLKDMPIPRTEYVDDEIELVLENLDLSSFKVNPAHVVIRNTTAVDVHTSEAADADTTTKIGTTTTIRLQAVQLALQDVSFYHKEKKHSAVAPQTFTGLAAVTMPPEGVDVDITLELIPSAHERAARRAYHRITHLEVQISADAALRVRESNHAVMLLLGKPVLNKRFRAALARTLGAQLRRALEALDGVAWDVGRRAGVFGDTGMGRGAALAAAVWSEVGRLARERRWGWRTTGTGVVLESESGGAQGRGAQFAMGAEPQVLDGDKRGPLGMGAQPLKSSLRQEGGAGDGGMDIAHLQTEGKKHVDTFQRSVDEKSAREKQSQGWRSEAFDI